MIVRRERPGDTAAARAVHGVDAPDVYWGVHFQVRVLDPSAVVAGPFVYAEPFDGL